MFRKESKVPNTVIFKNDNRDSRNKKERIEVF